MHFMQVLSIAYYNFFCLLCTFEWRTKYDRLLLEIRSVSIFMFN